LFFSLAKITLPTINIRFINYRNFWVIGRILPFLLPDDMSRQLTSETKVITAALIISGFMPNFPYIILIDNKNALAYIASE